MFPVKVNIKGEEISKLGFEVFGGRKVGITHEGVGVGCFDDIDELAEKVANPLGAIPAHNLRRNLIAHQVSEYCGMASAGPGALRDSLSDLRLRASRVQKSDV